MFFYQNEPVLIDLGTGNNNKINWALNDKNELMDIIETVYRDARKEKGLVASPNPWPVENCHFNGIAHICMGLFDRYTSNNLCLQFIG